MPAEFDLPELLAPAGSMESLTAALRCGADAVYVGARQFSARAHAENFDADGLEQAAKLCHLANAKLFLAVNTLMFGREFTELDVLLQTAAGSGIDGCIVQDMGVAAYIAKRLPTLRLHASTQLSIHTPAGVRFAKTAGFCRVVLARELSYDQIAACISEAHQIGMETEVFVHGAHCMSVSGQCWMSAAMGGRSANRGCCAQPCRLPFTADPKEREYCGLSLKDMSLAKHLDELKKIGVDSLKIEGRMKRPEYVAAAVTAFRAALDNQQPDMQTLQAVFSRSGFTDGYFTGQRKDMFGTRRKEDVTAAQGVLSNLRELYQKPRKCVEIEAVCTMRAEEPTKLTLRGNGCEVTVAGDIPQKAEKHPTDIAMLEKQFSKLGDTVYTLNSLQAEADTGLMLPASSLNALRRKAVEALDVCRIQKNTPTHKLGEKPEQNCIPYKTKQYGFRVQIRTMKQLSGITGYAEQLEFLMIPLLLADEYLQAAPIPLDRVMLVPPRFICDEADYSNRLKHAWENGYRHLVCSNAADILIGKKSGFILHGGIGLHLTNGYAAGNYVRFGLADGLRSPECGRAFPAEMPIGMFAYGRLPLMLVRNCPVQEQIGCGRCKHRLIDRRGMELYTDCTRYTDRPDYAELFNGAVVWLADRLEILHSADYGLIFLTDETPERISEVLGAYLNGIPIEKPAAFTRGLNIVQ